MILESTCDLGRDTRDLAWTETFSKYSRNNIASFIHLFMSHLLPKQLSDTRLHPHGIRSLVGSQMQALSKRFPKQTYNYIVLNHLTYGRKRRGSCGRSQSRRVKGASQEEEGRTPG